MAEYRDFDYYFQNRKSFNYYNSERREVVGGGQINRVENIDNHYWIGSVNTFANYDFSGCFSPDTALHIPIATYANGLRFVWDAYVYNETSEYITLRGDISVYDKNNNDVSDAFYQIYNETGYTAKQNLSIACGKENNRVSSCTFRTLGAYTYYYQNSTPPSRMSFIWANADEDRDMQDAPSLSGDIDTNDYERYYTYASTFDITDNDGYQRFLNALEMNGDGTPVTPILPSEDTSDPGGGDDANPDYNPFSDPIDFPGLPTGGSALSTGFIRVYTPTATQLRSLAGVLWSDDFIDTIKKIQNDPMEAIISLHSLPVSIASGTAECRIGNFNTGVTMNTISSQYIKRDLGSIYIPEHWASALDYGPYNTVDIFLPYIGVRSLQIDDVVGKTLSVEYNIDVLSGATVASIKCGNSVLYTYNTSLIAYHPISQSSYGLLFQSVAGAMGNVLSGAVSGGIGGAVGGGLGSAINVALSKHSTVSRGGSIGANSGCLGSFTPYIIIHRPIQSLASGFAHFKGYPSNITATLGSVSGYTEVESIHLNGFSATDSEKAEIEALLYNGVIL